MSCFVVLSSVLFRLQLSVLGPTALKLLEYSSLVFLCLSALSHKIGFKTEKQTYLVRRRTKTQKYTRELYLNNLRAVGPRHAQLKTKQKRKQDNKTRHRDQNKVNK